MGYTMLKNELPPRKYAENSLEGAAIKFIRERCEKLRFEEKYENKELLTDISNIDFDNVDFKSDYDEKNKIDFLGTSAGANQIPYNMEKDIDRLCLENAIARFLKSGKKEDAFDVYFCYIEMFIGNYGVSRRLIELLSEFEANGSALLMKHRDHYSHSVYVFSLGLAIYESNSHYRDAYYKFYYSKDKEWSGRDCNEMAHHFLKYWGLTSLFHDIGYPFELPFEQVESYFEVSKEERKNNPYISYNKLYTFTQLDYSTAKYLNEHYEGRWFETTDEVLAYAVSNRLSEKYNFTEGKMLKWLRDKPSKPDEFGYFMDHGYFSATLLLKNIFDSKGEKKDNNTELTLNTESLDALSAILMHNSLFKFCINVKGGKSYKKTENPLEMKDHPLAYMLMLCDEMQCWDRTAYGRNSRHELHPMNVEFDFSNDGIKATYIYDEEEKEKIEAFKVKRKDWGDNGKKEDKKPKLKAYSDMHIDEFSEGKPRKMSDFESDIRCIVKIPDNCEFSVETKTGPRSKGKNATLSTSNFISLYNFAVILNARYSEILEDVEKYIYSDERDAKTKEYDDRFNSLSLEYKLSNINQAKGFAVCLNRIDCFYSDQDTGFDLVTEFTDKNKLDIMGRLEHKRWLQEHYDMGWKYGKDYVELVEVPNESDNKETKTKKLEPKDNKRKRETLRHHYSMIKDYDAKLYFEDDAKLDFEARAEKNYNGLQKTEQDKDTKPMQCMLAMLRLYDGLRIYNMKNN